MDKFQRPFFAESCKLDHCSSFDINASEIIKGFGRPGSFCCWVTLCSQLFTHRNLLNGVPNTNEGIGCDFFLQNSVEIRIEEKGERRVKSIQKSEIL